MVYFHVSLSVCKFGNKFRRGIFHSGSSSTFSRASTGIAVEQERTVFNQTIEDCLIPHWCMRIRRSDSMATLRLFALRRNTPHSCVCHLYLGLGSWFLKLLPSLVDCCALFKAEKRRRREGYYSETHIKIEEFTTSYWVRIGSNNDPMFTLSDLYRSYLPKISHKANTWCQEFA